MSERKFKIYTLGCKVNQYDSGQLKNKLLAAGFLEKREEESADIVIVNTCSVTKNAHRKDRLILKKAKRENPNAKVVLMGCWYKVYPEIEKNLKADLFWPVGNLNALVNTIKEKIYPTDKTPTPTGEESSGNINPPGQGERSRYFLKAQDGCNQFCSYCAIPHARGRLRSRPWEEVVQEAVQAERVGYREIVLTGIHLGLYNQEKNSLQKEKDLAWLIRKIIRRTNQLRVRISSIEVNDLNEDLISLLKTEKRFCKHLHIPLQGGDNQLLRKMNRPYDLTFFNEKINQIRQAEKKTAITTDVIVGFPGETEKQFANSKKFIQQIGFSKLHVFPFSRHEKTPAAKMPNQLNKQIKKERSRELRVLSDKLWQNYQTKIKKEQKEFTLVVESVEGKYLTAKTEYYFNLRLPLSRCQGLEHNKKIKSGAMVLGKV